jgi:hypothetical protein
MESNVMGRSATCEKHQESLLDALAGTLEPARCASLEQHVRECADCAAASAEIEESWQVFSTLPPLEPPPLLRERTKTHIVGLLADERTHAAAPRTSWYAVSSVPLAVLSGLAVTAATLSLLGGLIWGSALPQGHLFFCAAIYTGLLVGAFSWIYGATTVNGVHLDAAARVGVLALAITVAATTACPEFHVLAWWDRSQPGQLLSGMLGAGGSSLVFGFGYGLMPGFLAALFGGRLLAERPLANGIVAAAVVFLLAAPVIYLQSAPFTWGVIATWAAGTAAGVVCGVLGALRVRERLQAVPAGA